MEKKLKKKVKIKQKENPLAKVSVWCMDEHRLGLKPIYRRVWAPIGEQITADVNWKYQWLWLYGFVHPESGETYFWILPKVNTSTFCQVLKDFAREFNINQNNQVILVVDNAGWHVSKEIKENLPEGLSLEFLPPYSPELQPAERLWAIVDEPLANRSFSSIDEVEEAIYDRCQKIFQQSGLIKGLTNYYWWPQTSKDEL